MQKQEDQKEIELISQILVDQYEDIANDFIPKIFGVDKFLITDESSIYDFNFEIVDGKIKRETEATLKKIKEVYGIDVSDIEDLLLIKIFERIRILGKL